MCFPPPVRYYAPLLVLVFGLATTWLDYEINVANDLARNYGDVAAQANVTGARLAKLAERQIQGGELAKFEDDLAAWADEPWMNLAALVDAQGIIIADSNKHWAGRVVKETPLAPAMKLALKNHGVPRQQEARQPDQAMVFGAYPVTMGKRGTGWILLVFDRTDAEVQARVDAGRQLRWMAAAIMLLCFCLWTALHFGFADRLARLTRSVRDFGEDSAVNMESMPGGDEVHELSVAFTAMGKRLAERDAERVRLEREILHTSETECRRIGQDLHDDIGQRLTAASLATMGLITALESQAPELAPQAENLSEQIRQTIGAVRTLSHGLAPMGLHDDDGLMNVLQELATSTARSARLRCVFECPAAVSVSDAAVAGTLYRIAQEAVNNALKHADPGEIRVGLERCNGSLVLVVEDDGEGLPETLASGSGIGFQVMRHRAQLVGGKIDIGPAPAGGTRIACTIPSNS